jgi:hypothetical protein
MKQEAIFEAGYADYSAVRRKSNSCKEMMQKLGLCRLFRRQA